MPTRVRARRGAAFYVGLGLVLAGLALLGYVAWQFFGTNVVSERKQRSLVEKTEQVWRAAPTGDQAGDHAGDRADDRAGLPGTADALIRIPRFGRDYVMPVQEGVSDAVLAEGFGHFERSAEPGQRGNYALAAHRITHGQPLRQMPELRPGDTVLVETREATYTYVLDTDPNDLVVTFRDVWVVDPKPINPDSSGVQAPDDPRLITLTTCAELFHTDNRMIAFGHLVSSTPR
jgi:sortase A